MFSLEKVMVMVANLVVVVVKACECMNHHVLQEGSTEWDDQREVDGEVEDVGEEVAMVDEVFEGAFGALGDKTW
nr:hypothetical protein [Tanacetum cinerariifolium]